MFRYRFFRSRISKIILFLDYDLSEATYWPPNDLYEVKINICNILVYGCLTLGFWVKHFKNNICFGLWPLGGHILASKWPLRGQNFEVSIFALWVFRIGFLGQRFQKLYYFWTMTSRRPHIGLQMTSERSKLIYVIFWFMGI